MKKIFLFLVMALAFSSSTQAQTTLSATDQTSVLRDIRYMIYDEIHILAQNYMNTDLTDRANMVQLGQQKITELQTAVKGFFGGSDAPNSMYQQAVTSARQFEANQLPLFSTTDEQAAVEQVFQTYGAKGVQGQ